MTFISSQTQSISDCNALILLFVHYFNVSISSDLSLKSNFSCAFIMYILRVSVHIPSWIQVLITYDRYISVVYPNRFHFIKEKRKLAVIIICIILVLMLFNSANLWFSIVETSSSKNITTNYVSGNTSWTNISILTSVSRSCTSNKGLFLYRDIVGAVFRSVFPFIFMFVGNCLLIRAFLSSKKRSKSHNLKQPTALATGTLISLTTIRKEHQFAVTIFVLNIFFIIIYSPLAVTIVLSGIYYYDPSLASPTWIAGNTLAFNISVYIGLLNNILPFFVNLKFNKLFRKEFINMLHDLKIMRRRKVDPQGSTIIKKSSNHP